MKIGHVRPPAWTGMDWDEYALAMRALIPPSLFPLFVAWLARHQRFLALYETDPFAALEAFREERRRCL